MPNFYMRLPHYVAAYFRNKNEKNPIPVGGVLQFDKFSPMWSVLQEMLFNNADGTVVRGGCFCERQWRKMMQGIPIYILQNGEERIPNLNPAEFGYVLTDKEVSYLSRLTLNKSGDYGEYLCIKMSDVVIRNGKTYKVNSQWQPTHFGYKALSGMMNSEFWRAFFYYMGKDQEFCQEKGIKRSVLESIERFMMRYDIRNSSDDREKMTLKRNYYRKQHSAVFNEDDYVEHGE